MSEDALIRLENLRELGLGPAELKRAVGSSYQYWNDLLDGKKSFGEKAARKIEEALGMVRGALDIPGFSRNENDAMERKSPTAVKPVVGSQVASLAQALEFLANYFAGLESSDRKEAMRQISTLTDEPERHAKIAAAIEAMAGTAFAQGRQKAA